MRRRRSQQYPRNTAADDFQLPESLPVSNSSHIEAPYRPRVLMVDDVLDQLDLYAMVLEPYVEVSKASRGEMAIAMALAHPPDLIVLDLLLPDVNGFDVCRRLRGATETAAIPIIFLTGDEASLFKAMGSPEFAGVFAILKKPATGDRLLTTIRRALNGVRHG